MILHSHCNYTDSISGMVLGFQKGSAQRFVCVCVPDLERAEGLTWGCGSTEGGGFGQVLVRTFVCWEGRNWPQKQTHWQMASPVLEARESSYSPLTPFYFLTRRLLLGVSPRAELWGTQLTWQLNLSYPYSFSSPVFCVSVPVPSALGAFLITGEQTENLWSHCLAEHTFLFPS